jgi:hypothetical protein
MNMNQNVNWKRGLFLLLMVELFLIIPGVYIHEWVHSIFFWFCTGQLGTVHVFDAVAYSYHTWGVCILPANLAIHVDVVISEVLAYTTQFICTAAFGLILWKKYYSPSEARARKSPTSPTR